MDIARLDLLEERIRKAVALIRALREEKAAAEKRLAAREQEIAELQAKLAEAPEPEEDLAGELETLRRERRAILDRVTKMLAILDEGALPEQKSLLAAVDGNE